MVLCCEKKIDKSRVAEGKERLGWCKIVLFVAIDRNCFCCFNEFVLYLN